MSIHFYDDSLGSLLDVALHCVLTSKFDVNNSLWRIYIYVESLGSFLDVALHCVLTSRFYVNTLEKFTFMLIPCGPS